MPINSKSKGARFERQLAARFREYGYKEARRSAQYCGNTGEAADIVNLPGIHVEAKHQEAMRLYEWMAQAKRDAEAGGENRLPVVFHKKNNAEILVTMELEAWMNLYNEWQAGQYLNEKAGGESNGNEQADTGTAGD
jgi:Holliday junction resolvase